MQEKNSRRSFRVTLLFSTFALLLIAGIVFWKSESSAVLESPAVSKKNLAAEWEQLGEDEARDSLFRSKMVESFHKLAIACGTDQNCLSKARSSLQNTFDHIQSGVSLGFKNSAKTNEELLYQEIKKLDRQWNKDAAKFENDQSRKVGCPVE
jgi:hypothetical protein